MVSFNDYVAYRSQLGDLIQPEAERFMTRPEGTSAQRARRSLDRAGDIMRAQTQRETAESNRDVGIATILGLLNPAARAASTAVRSAQGAKTFARSNDLMRQLQANERADSQMYRTGGPTLKTVARGANRVVVPPVALAQVDTPISDLGEGPLLLDQRMPMTPAGKAAESVNEGARVATLQNQDRRESSFLDTLLGNVDIAGLLQVFARPEFLQPGQSFAQGFSRAAAARTAAQQAQEATEAKAQREQQEIDIARQRAAAAEMTAEAAMEKARRGPAAKVATEKLAERFAAFLERNKQIKSEIQPIIDRIVGGTFDTSKPSENTVLKNITERAADIKASAPSISDRDAIIMAANEFGGQPATDPYANIGK